MVIKLAKNLLKFALYVAFVVTAVYFTPKVLARVLHTPYPMATITSGSMWPALKTNDLILMKGINGNDAEIGQIIVYQNVSQGFTPTPKFGVTSRSEGGFTIHRLVRKENGKLITKGDANAVEDSAIEAKDVIGRVVYLGKNPLRIPYLGIIARSLGPRIQSLKNI